MTAIQEQLFSLQDTQYRDFQTKLMPTVSPDTVIGVRTPALRVLAKKLAKTEEAQGFLKETPHAYFEENQLHAFLIAGEKDFGICMEELEQFLPYIDNWATCDQLSPGVFRKHREELFPYIDRWISSGHTYTVRFAIGMLMQHYLDEAFEASYAEWVAAVRSEEYYVNMMIAWYFATALAKQYEAVLPFIEEGKLERWTHNKTIQKAVESYRITPEQKAYLKTLKRPLVSHTPISL
ncbi:MAG: DNA alkylation repair protein [Clostridiales bacterium]|nr:DNA alkylation repair protein [Clostridiales bacterium]